MGTLSGATMSLGQRAATAVRRRGDPDWQPAVRTPDVRASATGLAVSMGVFANARYQIISGVDRCGLANTSLSLLCGFSITGHRHRLVPASLPHRLTRQPSPFGP